MNIKPYLGVIGVTLFVSGVLIVMMAMLADIYRRRPTPEPTVQLIADHDGVKLYRVVVEPGLNRRVVYFTTPAGQVVVRDE